MAFTVATVPILDRTHCRRGTRRGSAVATDRNPTGRAGPVAGEGAGADAVLRADPLLTAGAGRPRPGHLRGGRNAPAVHRLRRGRGVVRAGELRGTVARVRAPVPRPRRPCGRQERPGRGTDRL